VRTLRVEHQSQGAVQIHERWIARCEGLVNLMIDQAPFEHSTPIGAVREVQHQRVRTAFRPVTLELLEDCSEARLAARGCGDIGCNGR
jgi:hypothetical protein